jgi:hypothetical protein
MPGKGLPRIGAKFFHLFAQHVLVDLQIPSRLRDAHSSFLDQANRLDLELTPNLPSLA